MDHDDYSIILEQRCEHALGSVGLNWRRGEVRIKFSLKLNFIIKFGRVHFESELN